MPRRAAVVFNAASGLAAGHGADWRRQVIRSVLAAHSVRTLWYETSSDDTGAPVAQLAAKRHVDVLLVAGGDGTVMACASALVGTSVPLGIIPSGTGNIIAASLRIPPGVVDAAEVALHGDRVRIDVGTSESGAPFFATSIGFGAAVMRDTSLTLKARAGMLAYAVGAARHVRDVSGTFRLLIDNEPLTIQKSDGLLIGNFGQLMSRSRLPKTSLDDGLFEVGVLRIRPLLDWLRQGIPAVRPPRRPPLDWYQARQVVVECDRPRPTERDGEFVGLSSRLEAKVLPRSLLLCVPHSVDLPIPATPLLRWVLRDAGRILPRRPGIPSAATTNIASCTWHNVLGSARR